MESWRRVEVQSEHREKRDVLLEHLWDIGKVGVAIEGYLDRREPPGTFFDRYPIESSRLTKQERQRCVDIINAFRTVERETKTSFLAWLKQYVPDAGQLTSHEVGKKFVEIRFGFTPKFPLVIKEEPGFLLLFCEADDYEPISQHIEQTSIVKRSKGEYVPRISLFPEEIISKQRPVALILIKQSSIGTDSEISKQRSPHVFLHERQHFIQDRLLDLFFIDEPNPIESDIAIKDEVLAYIRGGSNGMKIRELLTEKEYPHLFPESLRELYLSVVEDIAASFTSATALHAHRTELIYALTGTPLRKIARRIRALDEYVGQYSNI